MRFLRNLFAVIGVLATLIAGLAFYKGSSMFSDYDPRFLEVYGDVAQRLVDTGDPGMAMMWSVPVEEGLSPEEVVESLKSLATARNFLFVGESPFYKQVQALTGEEYRYVNFLSFCDARIGKLMLEHHDQYSGFMPCRIALVEDTAGRLWLHTMNMDLMVHGGRELPPELKQGALRVRDTILEMMEGAARGDF
jgi:uncharacterized protein (DUF302 family)